MGLFSKIKKGLSKAWKGIKKGFKKVLGKIGKFLSSGWGKALMVVAGVVTMGAALAAGAAAYSAAATAGSGFFGSLAAGGSAVLSSLTGGALGTSAEVLKAGYAGGASTVGQAAKVGQAALDAQKLANVAGAAGETVAKTGQQLVSGAGGAGAQAGQAAGAAGQAVGQATQATQSATGGLLKQASAFAKNPVGKTIEGVTQGGKAVVNTLTGAGGGAGAGTTVATTGGAAGTGTGGLFSTLGKAAKGVAKGAYSFATSEGGGQFLGKVVEGYAQGRMLEEQAREERKQRRRLDAQWRDFDWNTVDMDIDLGRGWRDRALRTARDLDRSSRIDQTTVQRPDVAAGYA